MRRFFFILVFVLGAFPWTVLAAENSGCYCNINVCASGRCGGAEVNYGTGVATDDATCKTYCDNKVTTDYQTLIDSGTGSASATSRWVSPEAAAQAEAEEQEKKAELRTPILSIRIPGLSLSKPFERAGKIVITFLPEYIAGVYRYALGIAALFAIVMIMIGGVQYMIGSGTGGESVAAAKTRIVNAITGLVLVLCAYTILYVVNPDLTAFDALEITQIQEIPLENMIDLSDANSTSETCLGGACYGISFWQDCMLKNYGGSAAEVEAQLVNVTLTTGGSSTTFKVHKKIAPTFQAAFDAIAASGTSYAITGDSGTYAWRANVNKPTVLSFHSWGTAIDLNPGTNPNCPATCFDNDAATSCDCVGGSNCASVCAEGTGDLPTEIVSAFTSNGFNWLGDRPKGQMQDFMHFSTGGICGAGR